MSKANLDYDGQHDSLSKVTSGTNLKELVGRYVQVQIDGRRQEGLVRAVNEAECRVVVQLCEMPRCLLLDYSPDVEVSWCCLFLFAWRHHVFVHIHDNTGCCDFVGRLGSQAPP